MNTLLTDLSTVHMDDNCYFLQLRSVKIQERNLRKVDARQERVQSISAIFSGRQNHLPQVCSFVWPGFLRILLFQQLPNTKTALAGCVTTKFKPLAALHEIPNIWLGFLLSDPSTSACAVDFRCNMGNADFISNGRSLNNYLTRVADC